MEIKGRVPHRGGGGWGVGEARTTGGASGAGSKSLEH